MKAALVPMEISSPRLPPSLFLLPPCRSACSHAAPVNWLLIHRSAASLYLNPLRSRSRHLLLREVVFNPHKQRNPDRVVVLFLFRRVVRSVQPVEMRRSSSIGVSERRKVDWKASPTRHCLIRQLVASLLGEQTAFSRKVHPNCSRRPFITRSSLFKFNTLDKLGTAAPLSSLCPNFLYPAGYCLFCTCGGVFPESSERMNFTQMFCHHLN